MMDVKVILEDLYFVKLLLSHNLNAFSVEVVGTVEIDASDGPGQGFHKLHNIGSVNQDLIKHHQGLQICHLANAAYQLPWL